MSRLVGIAALQLARAARAARHRRPVAVFAGVATRPARDSDYRSSRLMQTAEAGQSDRNSGLSRIAMGTWARFTFMKPGP